MPYVEYRSKRKPCPYITVEIMLLFRKRNLLFRKFKQAIRRTYPLEYHALRRKIITRLRLAKDNYWLAKYYDLQSSSQVWALLDRTGLTKKKSKLATAFSMKMSLASITKVCRLLDLSVRVRR